MGREAWGSGTPHRIIAYHISHMPSICWFFALCCIPRHSIACVSRVWFARIPITTCVYWHPSSLVTLVCLIMTMVISSLGCDACHGKKRPPNDLWIPPYDSWTNSLNGHTSNCNACMLYIFGSWSVRVIASLLFVCHVIHFVPSFLLISLTHSSLWVHTAWMDGWLYHS